MIEYFDFLLFQDREDVLKILWDYTIRVGEKAMQMLVTRVVDVLRDCNRLIDEGNAIAVLRFRNKVKTAIVTSFRSNK